MIDAELVIDDGRIRMDPAMLLDPEAFEVTPLDANRDYIDRMSSRRDEARRLADARLGDLSADDV